MGLLGVSLIVASVISFCFFPQAWLKFVGQLWRQTQIESPPRSGAFQQERRPDDVKKRDTKHGAQHGDPLRFIRSKADRDRAAMPPPSIIRRGNDTASAPSTDEQTTPRASAAQPQDGVPTFSLSSSDAEEPGRPSGPPTFPAPFSAQRASSVPGLVAPLRLPSLSPIASTSRNLPIPNRGPPASTSLTPPPTHSSKPSKPSRKVMLDPGHSPLDWARISGPNADLRNLPSSTPYLRVTPSMLKKMTGRKSKDAWTALGGRIYNITPYLPFHPGGEPELLRCAGRDGNKLFGEIHPWVNYETMLAACLVGILVDEEDGGNEMEEMD